MSKYSPEWIRHISGSIKCTHNVFGTFENDLIGDLTQKEREGTRAGLCGERCVFTHQTIAVIVSSVRVNVSEIVSLFESWIHCVTLQSVLLWDPSQRASAGQLLSLRAQYMRQKEVSQSLNEWPFAFFVNTVSCSPESLFYHFCWEIKQEKCVYICMYVWFWNIIRRKL